MFLSPIKFANWKVQQPIVEDHQALFLLIFLIPLLPSHNDLLLPMRHLSIFLPRLSTTASNSLLHLYSLCLITLFLLLVDTSHLCHYHLYIVIRTLPYWFIGRDDISFQHLFIFSFGSSIVEVYSAFSLAFTFYRKKVAIWIIAYL